MAISKGKKEVNIKPSIADNIGIPKVHTFDYVKPIADAASNVIDAYTENAALAHSANFKSDFNIKATDAYLDFLKKHENNPVAMKQATEAYNQSIIDGTPLIYKEYVTSILAGKHLNAMSKATANRTRLDNELAVSGSDKVRTNTQNDISENFQGINENDVLPFANKIESINSNTVQMHMKTINENSGNDLSLVQSGLINPKDHNQNVETSIKNLEIERVFQIMAAYDSAGKQNEAMIYLHNYLAGKDNHALDFNNVLGIEDLNNPVFDLYKNFMKNSTNYQNVGKEVYSKWRLHKANLKSMKESSSTTFDMEKEKELTGGLHWNNFFNGKVTNVHDLVSKLDIIPGSSKYRKAIEYASKANMIAGMVDSAWANPELKLNFAEPNDEKLFVEATLAKAGIFDQQTLLYPENPDDRAKAIELLKQHNIVPEKLVQWLSEKPNASFEIESVMKDFKQKMLVYQNMKGEDNYPNMAKIELLDYALANDVMGMTNEVAGKFMNERVSEKFEERLKLEEKIKQNHADDGGWFGYSGETKFNHMINKEFGADQWWALATPFWWASNTWVGKKFYMTEENPNAKHLMSKTTHWLPKPASKLIPPSAKAEFEGYFLNEMSKLMPLNSKDFDIYSDANAPLRKIALNNAMQRMRNNNYGVTEYSSKSQKRGDFVLEKNPIELTFGKIKDLDIYSHIASDVARNGNSGWGELNWQDEFKKYADGWDSHRIIFTQTGGKYRDKPGYKMSMIIGNLRIDIDSPFYPKGFDNELDESAPSTVAQVKHKATSEAFEEFKKTKLYSMLPEDDKHWSKKFIYGMIGMDKSISEFRWYPDLPFFDDTPREWRPFKYLGWFMSNVAAYSLATTGHLDKELIKQSWEDLDYDLREDTTHFKIMADKINDNLSTKDKINNNTFLKTTEVAVQNLNWPNKAPLNEADNAIQFKHFATTNYKDETIPLTFRTNNWFALSSAKWEGEIEGIEYTRGDRKFAVFSHPADSARAVTRMIINNSALTYGINDVKKVLGETPTVWDILSKIPYATNLKPYEEALKASKAFDKDTTIDLQDKNQMHKFLKFIMITEMGVQKFNEYFPVGSQHIVDTYIMMGLEKGLHSYDGRLGTYKE